MLSSRLHSLVPLAFCILLVAPAILAQSGQPISLTVDATQSPQKLLHGHLVIPVQPGPLTLYYPKWIPGDHMPDGPIADLTGLKFEANGKTIPWQRDLLDAFTFHLDIPSGATSLDASYNIIEPDGDSATDKLMVLEWNEAILYPAGTPSAQLTYDASLILPDGWKYGTALPVASESGNQVSFKPISLELLVDSPVIAGQYYRVIDITPPGEPIHHEIDIVADSEAALAMTPDMQKEMTNVVAEAGKLFGTRHYRDYHFLLTLSDHVAHFGLSITSPTTVASRSARSLVPRPGCWWAGSCPTSLSTPGMESSAVPPIWPRPTLKSPCRTTFCGFTRASPITSDPCSPRAAA
jgi:predicted metalloprotease with PDZ domain